MRGNYHSIHYSKDYFNRCIGFRDNVPLVENQMDREKLNNAYSCLF